MPSGPQENPELDDVQEFEEESTHEEVSPNSNLNRKLLNILSAPDGALWNGLLDEDFLYFIDDVGFGWKVNLQSDEFFLTGEVYNISHFINIS